MVTVGIGEFAITNEVEESIITYALGSCVALIIHNPATKHTALAHVVLPNFNRKGELSYLNNKPAYYADLIVPKLVNFFLCTSGCKENQLQIQLVGGADSLNKGDVFHVGIRNIEMIKTILRSYSLAPFKTDVGGNFSRTVQVNVKDGNVIIKSNKMII